MIFVSVAEQSADLHAANLIRAMRRIDPDQHFAGVAGPLLQAEGCEAIDDMTPHAAMLLGAVGNVRRGIDVLKKVDAFVGSRKVEAAVLVDSPTLHLPMAKRLKKRGVPVFYYVAPQVWAWAPWRIGRIRRRVTKLACILPFEEEYFRSRGVDATFVGHPLFDELRERNLDADAARRFSELSKPVVAVLPGSRRHVVEAVLPGQLEVVEQLRSRFVGLSAVVSKANERVGPVVEEGAKRIGVEVSFHDGPNDSLLSAADMALVASGTSTLEVAHHGVPMVVMYQANRLMYHLLGRWLIRTPYLCLVNILAQRELVPEFMPYYTSTAPIAETAATLLSNTDRAVNMRRELLELVKPLGQGDASMRAAELLMAMVRADSPQ